MIRFYAFLLRFVFCVYYLLTQRFVSIYKTTTIIKNKTKHIQSEYPVCVRTCTHIRHMDRAMRCRSRFLQVQAAFVRGWMLAPPPQTSASDGLCLSNRACLKGHVWLCRYLLQHVGVMVDLFIYSSFFGISLAKELFVIISHLNPEANFVVWSFRQPKMTALVIKIDSFSSNIFLGKTAHGEFV